MTLIDFLNRLLGREKPSGTLARERLQLVLAHDRSDLNPELLEQMRREILEVVQRYVEIDIESCDVSLETEDRVTALLANLPIRRARPVPLPRPDAPATDGDAPSTEGGSEDASGASPEDGQDGETQDGSSGEGAANPPPTAAEGTPEPQDQPVS